MVNNKYIICCIIFFIIFVSIYYIIEYKNNNNETFVSIRPQNLYYSKQNKRFGDPLTTFKSYRDRSITELFPDVKIYENDYGTLRMGLDKCIEYVNNLPLSKRGNCMEMGITGNAYYFPITSFTPRNFKDDISKYNKEQIKYRF